MKLTIVILGVKENRTREVLDIVNFSTESGSNWSEIFDSLKQRGVEGIDLFVCYGLYGIENSIISNFSGAKIQLCTVHLKRNIIIISVRNNNFQQNNKGLIFLLEF